MNMLLMLPQPNVLPSPFYYRLHSLHKAVIPFIQPKLFLYHLTDKRRITHIQSQLKLTIGDRIRIGRLNGLKGTGIIVQITDDLITIQYQALKQLPPPKLPVILVVALPRPKVLRRLIMDAVTLGVEKMILLHSYRVEKSYWQSPFLEAISDYAQLGLEQAGDTVMPQIELAKRFKPFIEDDLPQLGHNRAIFLAHPYALQPLPAQVNAPCLLIIGCEGGFIPYEVALMQKNGAQSVHFGPRILRTETAMATLLGHLF